MHIIQFCDMYLDIQVDVTKMYCNGEGRAENWKATQQLLSLIFSFNLIHCDSTGL